MEAEFDREKFKDAMHYVIAKASGRAGFGAIKLYKVLWFSDAKWFLLHGKPITGEQYVRQKYGPVPKHGLPVLTELEKEGRIKVWKDWFFNRQITRFKTKVPPQTDRLSRDEIQTLDYWMKHIAEDHTAESISDESHDYAWEIAKMGEPLPYYSFLASRLRDPTDEELAKARARRGSLGL